MVKYFIKEYDLYILIKKHWQNNALFVTELN